MLAAESWGGYTERIWDSQATGCLGMVSKFGDDSVMPKVMGSQVGQQAQRTGTCSRRVVHGSGSCQQDA